ncbi:MAG: hypothetical protein H6Q89_3129 [Myxococcaceae bacterium]|nr:hypothetical protein [Myxococcaceae bacterium]
MATRLSTALAVLLAAVHCGGPPPSVVGSWTFSDPSDAPEPGRDPLLGTWDAQNGGADETTWNRFEIAFGEDSTWRLSEEKTYKVDAAAHAGCTEKTTWMGTFTKASNQALSLSNSTTGARVRSGCAAPAENGASTSSTPLNGTYRYGVNLLCGARGTCDWGLGIDAVAGIPVDTVRFLRIDRKSVVFGLTFGADNSWEGSQTTTFSATAYQLDGCIETLTQRGQYTPVGETRRKITYAGPTVATRTSCTDGSRNGKEMSNRTVVLPAGECSFTSGYQGTTRDPNCDVFLYIPSDALWVAIGGTLSSFFGRQ